MEPLSKELTWRGFVNQTTLDDLAKLDNAQVTFYHGFDASADSQTIGNLAAMMLDMVFLRHGHKAILLAGGATSLIGDPGGKDGERPLQTEEAIRHNVGQAEAQLRRIFSGYDFTLVNNLDWFKNMPVINFLRDIGKHFGISTLIQRDYIQKRIGEGGSGMSFTELSYTLLQGYDFLHLFDEYGCTLQLAGADQWGNSLSGVDLIRKTRGQETHVITLPLIINSATGKKFGKTEAGAVWLDESKTSVFAFYQFWLNVDDSGVETYLKIYTALSRAEIESLITQTNQNPAARAAQKTLAFTVTKLVHGQERAESVRRVSEVLFGDRVFEDLSDDDLNELAREIPAVEAGKTVADILVEAGLASSKGDARRLISGGGVLVGANKAADEQQVIQNKTLIKKGKNSFILVR